MNNDLILFRRDGLAVAPLDLAGELMETALAQSITIGSVTDPESNKRAVAAQIELKTYLEAVEKSRKLVKEPLWDACKSIDALAKELTEEVSRELMRVSKLVGDYQTLEQAKARAAEAARMKELAELEQKKQLELAQAASHEHMEAIQERYNQVAAAIPVAEAPKATGQVVKEDWEIEVTDPQVLAAHHYPECCDIVPRLAAIKARLTARMTVRGVVGTRVTKAQVRTSKRVSIDL